MKPITEVNFHKHRKGCLHMRCPRCGRPMSNVAKTPDDPPDAVYLEMKCPECCVGDKEIHCDYYDADGNEVFRNPDTDGYLNGGAC